MAFNGLKLPDFSQERAFKFERETVDPLDTFRVFDVLHIKTVSEGIESRIQNMLLKSGKKRQRCYLMSL